MKISLQVLHQEMEDSSHHYKEVYDSEEDGEMENDEPKMKLRRGHCSSESFAEDDDEGIGDSLHIKPPQAVISKHSRQKYYEKHRRSRKRESSHHNRRSSQSERKRSSHSSSSRHSTSRRHQEIGSHKKTQSEAMNKGVHKFLHKSEASKENARPTSGRDQQEKMLREWRKKRLLYADKQRFRNQTRSDYYEKDRFSKHEKHPSGSSYKTSNPAMNKDDQLSSKNTEDLTSRNIFNHTSPLDDLYRHALEDLESDHGDSVEDKEEMLDKQSQNIENEGEEEVEECSGSTSSSSSMQEEESSFSEEEEDEEEKKLPSPKAENSPPLIKEDLTDKEQTSTNKMEPSHSEVSSTSNVAETESPTYCPAIQGCRSVEEFHCLNRIEEGTYGVVYRARDKRTNEIVALKRLKMEKEKEGFPITSLREINTLLKAQHPNIVTVREIVVGSNMDKIYIVMDYVEHDLKSLMETMKTPFLIAEVKTLLYQLLKAIAHLHDNWILHRDIKTSNLLLSHKGILKVGDFGLAREYGSPLKPYTPVVVTLWYRAPELLLGTKEYSTPIDMWSVGCVFGELLTMKALFPGKSEVDQLTRIYKDLGTPSEKIWPGYSELPLVKKMTFAEHPYNNIRQRFGSKLTDCGFDLLNKFLTYCPSRRITAEQALQHDFFTEQPRPVHPSMFPTWPAKSEQGPRRTSANHSPKPPSGGKQFAEQLLEEGDDDGFHMSHAQEGKAAKGAGGFSLKF